MRKNYEKSLNGNAPTRRKKTGWIGSIFQKSLATHSISLYALTTSHSYTRYRNYLKKEVWLPYGNGKRQIPFTSDHVTLIMNETWKNVDNKNRWRRIANIINKQFPLQVDCTPNQVKNKYNTTFRKLRRLSNFAIF
ncbi:121_t:CDS:2 [Acaulospora morrowiae]|uniref:121_t:CDS:1 n=1 Tax=Acaulospora morrowiae TaxID=94023 RepID=A0A9N8WDM6_9GLOM|nr:121_t:CDS:2 [Acaulospora morrowiae]